VTAATSKAIETHRPLLTIVRTGGTRLQEGVAALVGIARAGIALADLGAAGLPHVSIADQPTTGGVWVSVVSRADLRVGVAGATVGFSGPRVIEAMTGDALPTGANTAESALHSGLLDAVLAPEHIGAWVGSALKALGGPQPVRVEWAGPVEPDDVDGWQQVQRARDLARTSGAALLDVVLDGNVDLQAADDTVRAVIGRSAAGRPTVGVAVSAARVGRPTTTGFALLIRAAALADRIGADLCTFVDTPGADPLPASEGSGLAPTIGAALLRVLECRSPSLAVVHGEGGSGGALAATVTDRVLVTESGYFTALAPEGAGMALHCTPADAANLGAVTPAALHKLGFADLVIADDPDEMRLAVAAHLAELAEQPADKRLVSRRTRWGSPLPGRC
jgi:acetyl-CoA carboxylase carboxyl transferase subunit beta